MYQLCKLTLLPHNKSTFTAGNFQAQFHKQRLSLTDSCTPHRAFSFCLLSGHSLYIAGIIRWFFLATGKMICIRRCEVKLTWLATSGFSILITLGWPCDCDFEISASGEEVATAFQKWLASTE